MSEETLEKARALSECLGLEVDDIVVKGSEFETPEGTYRVLTEEEVLEDIKDLCDDVFFSSESILAFLENNGLSYSDVYNEEWLRETFESSSGELSPEYLDDLLDFVETTYVNDRELEITKEMIDLDKIAEFTYSLDSASAISFYDGTYKEIGEYFIVRTN